MTFQFGAAAMGSAPLGSAPEFVVSEGLWKNGPLTGTIDKDAGRAITVALIKDE